MELDLDLTASFLILVSERHYGNAAARLNLTPPALTRRIQRLERQLGVRLIERGPAGVVGITAAGLRFAAAAGPLLDHAEAARTAARSTPGTRTLRFGIPAGAEVLLQHLNLAGVANDVRRQYPEVRIACVGVPFTMFTRSLTDGQVDVLWTNAPMKSLGIDSLPLGLTSRRIAIVAARHALADAGSVEAAALVEEPILYNPAIPDEWMRPFWLGDLRSRHEANLVPVDAQDNAAVLRHAACGTGIITSFEITAPTLGPQLRPVSLTGADPIVFHAAYRHADRRGPVLAVLKALLALGTHPIASSKRHAKR